MTKAIIVTGNTVDGFRFFGPFDDVAHAVEVAEENLSLEWHVAKLESPDDLP